MQWRWAPFEQRAQHHSRKHYSRTVFTGPRSPQILHQSMKNWFPLQTRGKAPSLPIRATWFHLVARVCSHPISSSALSHSSILPLQYDSHVCHVRRNISYRSLPPCPVAASRLHTPCPVCDPREVCDVLARGLAFGTVRS